LKRRPPYQVGGRGGGGCARNGEIFKIHVLRNFTPKRVQKFLANWIRVFKWLDETEKEKLEALIKKWRLLLRTILMYNVYICIGKTYQLCSKEKTGMWLGP
jgi:hypothetical protein